MSEKKVQAKFNHLETFKLMQYACQRCWWSEAIWNSRDGVTPFCLRCPRCGEITLEHVNWDGDVFAPDHIPNSGQRVFIDMPESLKRPLAAQRVRSFDGTQHEVEPDRRAEVIQSIIADFQPGTPWVIVWP